ncbi:MAG: hypothetical protein EOL86_06620 [Deltaproteobacteria bacterium]|nr:hypothetical protein [Deltaproteobacteria bacterium]
MVRVFSSRTTSPWRVFQLFVFFVVLAVVSLSGCVKVVSPPPSTPLETELEPSLPEISVEDVLLGQYEEWRGVPHRIGGTDKRGVDCSGLVQAVFRESFGTELPRTSAEQSRVGQAISLHESRPGDLVFFSDRAGDHIGIIAEDGMFLHASSSAGVTLSELDNYWLPRLKRVQRVLLVPELEE